MREVMVYRTKKQVRASIIGGMAIRIPPTVRRARVYVFHESDEDAVIRASARFVFEECRDAGKPCPSEAELFEMMR